MFKNLKILYKIILLTLSLLAFVGIVGFTGYYFNSKANKEMISMYQDRLLPVKWLNNINTNNKANESDILYIILNSGNQEEIKKLNADIDSRANLILNEWGQYKKTELDKFEVDNSAIVDSNLSSFRQMRTSITELSLAGKQQEAFAVLNKNIENYRNLQKGISDLAEYNAKVAEDINLQNDKDYKFQNLLLLGLILLSLILGIILSVLITGGIIKPIGLLKRELDGLAEVGGDLTQSIKVNTKDEIGDLAGAVNKFIRNLRNIISGVISETGMVENSVGVVNKNIAELNMNFEDVSATTEELSAGMEETAASTQEMNAASAEIEVAVESIATKAQEGATVAGEIKKRADDLKKAAITSQITANNIYENTNDKLKAAIEQSRAVSQINTLSSAILSITDQTNLLALNAAIEAARAGEAGKGFAVVADEIRKLADESKKTAGEIQKITMTVISSVTNLTESAQNILGFIDQQVVRDYEMLVKSGEQYSDDAQTVDSLVIDLSATSEQLLASMQNMTKAINEITSATNEGAAGTTNIAAKSTSIVEKASEIIRQTTGAKESTDRLIGMVSKFKV